MILGAGIYQLPLIKKAKDLGMYVIVCSTKGNYPGFSYADHFYYVDTTDRETILEISKKENIDGICTTGTDVAVTTIGYVCEKLGLTGISFRSAQIATNKANMKLCFQENQISTAPFYKIYSKEEALMAFDRLYKPVVIKIVDKSGSRGIYRIDSREQVSTAFEAALKQTCLPYILMEDFIHGHEIGIDALVQNEEIKLLLPHDKLLFLNGQTAIPIGHVFPLEMSETVINKLNKVAIQTISAMKLNNCAVNMDVFVTPDDEVFVIEVGGRAGATGIPELMSIYSGYNYYENILRIALGEEVFIGELEKTPCASILFHAPTTGILQSIHFPQMDNTEYAVDFEIGHHVNEMKNGTDRIGQAIIRDHSPALLKAKIERLLKETIIEVT